MWLRCSPILQLRSETSGRVWPIGQDPPRLFRPGAAPVPPPRLPGGDWRGRVAFQGRLNAVQKFPITAEGLSRLEEELKVLKSEERPAVIRAIAEARAHGDLSENAEYHAAREKQSFIEGRIAELESVVPSSEVIDVSKMTGEQVRFGAYVTIVDEESEDEKTYRIVGQYEADMKKGSISISSPLARALLGKSVGDSVEVPAPGGARSVEITAVRFR